MSKTFTELSKERKIDHEMISITTLAQSPHYYKETIDLIELSLLYNQGNRFEDDFYPLMGPHNHHNNFLLIKEKKVVGHIGVNIRSFGWDELSVPVALLGGIAIDPKYRGQGLFKDFFNTILEKFESDVCFFILWSNLTDLYKKFGFHQFGGSIQTGESSDENIPSFKKTTFPELSERQFSQIKNLYNESLAKFFAGFIRREFDWSNIKMMNSVNLYIKEEDDEVQAYFCFGKGHDLQYIIHEIGTPLDKLDALIDELKQYKLWLPEIYNQHFQKETISFLAFLKIANRKSFADFVNLWSRGEVRLLMHQEGKITFSHLEDQFQCSEEEFLTYLFGPNPMQEFQNYGRPLYLSGLDSV